MIIEFRAERVPSHASTFGRREDSRQLFVVLRSRDESGSVHDTRMWVVDRNALRGCVADRIAVGFGASKRIPEQRFRNAQ